MASFIPSNISSNATFSNINNTHFSFFLLCIFLMDLCSYFLFITFQCHFVLCLLYMIHFWFGISIFS